MTPQEFLISEGYDPALYTLDAEGYPTPLPPKRKISPIAAFGSNAARALAPAGAALLAGAKVGGATAAAGPFVAVPAAIGASLLAGFGVGKAQDVALDAIDPSINRFVNEAREQNPISGYAGDLLPSIAAFKPDVRGVRALANAFTPGMARNAASQAAMINVGANVAGSTAGQLAKMSQGGDFSLGEFAADTALGTLFNEPNRIGRRMGFQSTSLGSDMQTPNDRDLELSKILANRIAKEPSDPTARPVSLEADPIPAPSADEELGASYVPDSKKYERWWAKETEPTIDLIKDVVKQHKLKIGKERLAEIANEPYAREILAGDYTNWPEFIAMQSERALEAELTDPIFRAVQMSKEGFKPGMEEYKTTKVVDPLTGKTVTEEVPLSFEDLPEQPRQADIDAALTENAQQFHEIASSEKLLNELRELKYLVRRQEPDAPGSGPMTQEQLDAFTKILNRRGVKVRLADIDANGQWSQVGNDVEVVINPRTARLDTLVEELGHDVFNRSATPGMQKSLAQAIEENARYKSELEARLAEGMPRQQAEDIAREEGLMDVFRQRTGVDKAELASWWKAFKASMKYMVGARLSPEDAMAWLHYATHENVPWNSAGGNRGAVGASESRKQSLDPANSTVEALKKTSPLHARVGTAIEAQLNTRDYIDGQLRDLYESVVMTAPKTVLESIAAKRYRQMDTRTPETFTAEEKPINDAISRLLAYIPKMYNDAGYMIKMDKNTYRDRGAWDLYTPAHKNSAELEEIFRDPKRYNERLAKQDEFLQYTRDWYIKEGYTPEEAMVKAQEQLDREVGVMLGGGAAPDASSFAGSRRPLGPPLPPSWRSNDLASILDNYVKRTALDFAGQKHVESDPVVMAALGAKTYTNGAPIAEAILKSTPPIHNESNVQSLLRNANGLPSQLNNPTMMGASRLVSSAGLQHVSKVKDLTGTTFGWLKYLQPSDYVNGAADFANRLSNWSELSARSYASGLNKRDGAQQMRAVIGAGEYVGDWMTKAAEAMSKYTGLNGLEQVSRTIAQASGEVFVKIAKTAALNGDAHYAQMLDRLSPDWRARTDADLAAQFGRLLQGTYDARSVPAWALEGPAAPFFVWNRWSLGQYNNFKKFAIEPALRGDVRPLMGHLLIGMLGGSAVEAVSEWMNQRDGRDVNWSELNAWMQEHEFDGNALELLSQKLMAVMQHTGTFGFVGDLGKMMADGVATGSVQLPATMPLASAVQDATKRAGAILQALDAGEDFGAILKQAALDQAYSTVQMARVARNVFDEDAAQEFEDKRRMRVFNKLSGEPSSGNTFAQSYANVSERAFDRADKDDDLPGMASDLIEKAASNASNQQEFKENIRKLTTSPRGILPTKPTKAAEYLKWLGTMDPELPGATKARDAENKKLDRYKDQLIRQGAAGQVVGR